MYIVEIPPALGLAVHLVNFFGWVSQGDHSEPILLLAFFYQSTPSCLKVMGGVVVVVVRWVAHGILVSAQVPLVLTFGLWTLGLRAWA